MKSLIRYSISLVTALLFSFTYNVAQDCVVPDNGTGTAELPPMGCQYTSPDEVFIIIDGLPPGTTIEFDGPLANFTCGCPLCSMPLSPGECEGVGGSLGGNFHCFDGTLDFQVTGTGDLTGFTRTISVPVSCEVHTGPRIPADAVQTFSNDMFRLQGQLFGDPDFCTLNITAGTDFGLPSPGQTTLTDLGNGNFNVDSFFDITYQIEFEGCPGSVLEGMSGVTTATIRIETGEPVTTNDFVDPGPDFWIVPESPVSFITPGGPGGEVPEIPADFFGPGSDPFQGAIFFKGESLESPELINPDAVIERKDQADLPEPYPSAGIIETEIVELSLTGTAPITVTHMGGTNPELWEVELELSTLFPQGLGTMEITKNDASGGEFLYTPLSFYPALTFTKVSNPAEVRNWDPDPGTGMLPLGYTTTSPYPWEHSPMGSDFNPSGNSTMQLISTAGDCELYFNPYLLRQDDFWVEVDPVGQVINGGGSGFNDGEWYYYPNTNWWNIWFYDHPFDIERDKAINVSFILDLLDQGFDAYANIVINWSTGEWSGQGVPGQPPLPEDVLDPVIEDLYIVRSTTPIFIGPLNGPQVIDQYIYEILEYNPEWISIDIEGYNFVITEGTINHVCLQPDSGGDLDWGDAPDPTYPTMAANIGASHQLDGMTWLGDMVDGEPDGQPDPNALGDDNIGPDEDGVFFTSPIIAGQIATLDVFASIDGFLNLWVDFDINGSWAETNEYVFNDLLITAGLNNLSFPVPASSLSGISFARFRFTSDNGMAQSYEGGAANGEVEDYEIFIEPGQPDEIDWGDAPDSPFPTLSFNNGAHHFIIPQIYLGNTVDGEPDGQPHIQAIGDDNDILYPPPNDDEDGVIFTSALIPGNNATIDVVASIPGFLDAWIDFDQNGTWADANDQIFMGQPLVAGNNNLSFIVPAGVGNGNTFARFRFSTIGGLFFDGPAPDGEVEDYRIFVGIQTGDIPMDPDPNHSLVQNEISMALIPGNTAGVPAVLLAAYNDHPYPGGPGLGVSLSNDGGTTWIPQQLPYPSNPLGIAFLDMFDPTATADANGNLYVAHISSDYDWTNGPESGLYVHKSTDGGITWGAPVTIAYDGKPSSSPDPNYRFNDRCQITCDLNSTSPNYNNLYIVWIKDRGWNNPLLESDIYFSSSTDGGITWSPNLILNQSIHNLGNMPIPTIAPDGTIYVCWMNYNVQTGGIGTIYLNMSNDGGLTWLAGDILVTTVNLPPLNLNGYTDVLAKGAAVIDVSPFNPQELYITYAERIVGTTDEADIHFIKSTDAGTTWTPPLRVNDDATTNDQVLPWMDVKSNGLIDIAFYGRYDDGDINWRVIMATSTDGGNSFLPNVQLSGMPAPSPNTPSGYWMGEYLGLVVDDTDAYVGYTSSVYDINGDVFFAKAENPSMEIDFGDAPDPTFPTLLVNDGARHVIGNIFLGGQVDAEPDGQPDPNALGDDNNNIMDEDGVLFNWPLLKGSPVMVTVITSGSGFLNAWIDFDGDGTWIQANELIFLDFWLNAGTHTLNFTVPPNAIPGFSFARFRFSTQPNLSFTGLASDGEVEDYEVLIEENPDIKWQQLPNTSLPGLHSHDYVNAGGGIEGIVLADDWLCNGGLVTDIHWWGNYELDPLGQEKRGLGIDHFHVSIHMVDQTGVCLPMDPQLTGFNIPLTTLGENNTGLVNIEGCDIYRYDFILPQPFEQEAGNRYWVDITAVSVDPNMPPLWRWQEALRTYYPILCGAADKTEPNILPWSTIQWLPNPPHKYSDMAFIITSEELEPMDYGDADDPTYPTLLASDGARHIFDGVTFMGTSIDQEYNGQPDLNALGDDNDGNDDEDGVIFTSQLTRGNTATVDVEASVDGYLDAWIDFNINGTWEAGEAIFTSEPLVAGTNNLSFNVPSGATPGISYSRFRFSSYGGLQVIGMATDGEVEDHEIEIKEVPNKWVQYPNPELPGLHAHDANILGEYQSIILADDWICQGGWVTDIHWWGNYEIDFNGDEWRGSGIEYFHLSIHLLDTTTPDCIPLDPEMWGVDVPFSALTEIPTGMVNLEGSPIYLYEFLLENPFPQIEGTHYWLDITAVCTDPLDPAHWRWQESQRTYPPILCAAVEKTLPNPGAWNPIDWANETNSDMAFMITSAPVPEIDLGDANDPTYPTLLASTGAAHIIDYTVYLGNSIDAEPDGQPTIDAKGDDNDGNDDEDGVSFLSSFTPGGSVFFDINASADGFINAWIDYDGNGSWAEANEQIFTDQSVIAGSNFLIIPVPINANVGYTYARFRYNSSGGLSYTDIAQDGEVEDYEIVIEGDLDFGDAPDQAYPAFPTLLASNGARHVIDQDVFLGNSIDNEMNGQPDMTATGDDTDGNDDEDGVLIPALLGHGQMTPITVIASVDGYLNGWIDFNSSGNWTESDEHIFIDQAVTIGINPLVINVPSTSDKGTSYARFRFSTSPGLSFEGQALDGEVEDYQVEIGDPHKWIQNPDLSIMGMDIDATFKIDSPEPPMILADDFECTVTGPLTRIEIWGSWLNDRFPWYEDLGAVVFTLSIHKDIPADENNYSMPGQVLWWRTFQPGDFMYEPEAFGLMEGWYNPEIPWYLPFGDTECWKYIFLLPEGEEFVQEGTLDEPVVYWLDVQAEPMDPDPECRFGWKTSIDHWNDNAVWGIGQEPYPGPWEELIYPPTHELQGQAIDMAFAIYGDENPFMLIDLTVLLEGTWDGTSMGTSINNSNLLPLNQPYSIDPLALWHYTGTESVVAIPNADIVDWVLVELRDAPSAALADKNERVDQKAAFVLKDGSVVATDGFSMLKSYATITSDPYIVIWHRNHLGILSNNPLNLMGVGLYSYDFTAGPGQAYMNGQTNLGGTIYGMFGGDAWPDGDIQNSDKQIWEADAGTAGYKASDFNLDTQIDNNDKDDIWVPNLGEGTKVPN